MKTMRSGLGPGPLLSYGVSFGRIAIVDVHVSDSVDRMILSEALPPCNLVLPEGSKRSWCCSESVVVYFVW
jgi:hypothetical protein